MEQVLNCSLMTLKSLKSWRSLAWFVCIRGNEDWKVIGSDSQQLAGACSSPSGKTREDGSPPLMFRWRKQRAQLCMEGEWQSISTLHKHVHTDVNATSCVFLTVLACECVKQSPAAEDLLSASSFHFLVTDWQIFYKLIWLWGEKTKMLKDVFISYTNICSWKWWWRINERLDKHKDRMWRCLHTHVTEEKTGQLSHHLVHISTSSAALGEADYLDDKDTKFLWMKHHCVWPFSWVH